MRLRRAVFLLAIYGAAEIAVAATVSGKVVDVSGSPIEGARIDHMGKLVVGVPAGVDLKPSADQPHTDAQGHFEVTTTAPAVVIRKPGYESQRVFVTGDAQLQVTLQPISKRPCGIEHLPVVKTKAASDVDYTATRLYVETKSGTAGIISGHGPMYSFGAPSDRDVWTSLDYFEVMYDSGVIDARGHSADGKYWRSQTSFGAAAQYYGVDQSTAEILDCIMDRVP
jgi:hypothetical protein